MRIMTGRGSQSLQGVPSPVKIALVDLIPSDGLPSDRYKFAVSALFESFARYCMAVVQLPAGDDILLKCVLDSARMFFHHKQIPASEFVQAEDLQDWHRTTGYYAQPQQDRECFDYRPGRSIGEANSSTEIPPAGLPEVFSCFGKTARCLLEAIGWHLDLRSFSFTDLLDNIPLRTGDISTSVLSVCCHGRSSLHGVQHGTITLSSAHDRMRLPLFDSPEPHADKGLLTLVRSDKSGLQIRDVNGRWLLADSSLGPNDIVVYPGLSLYQATAGYVSPGLFRTEIFNSSRGQITDRCSVAFKLMPRASAILHSSPMTTAGHVVGGLFQQPVSVSEFMQRSLTMDQLSSRPGVGNYHFPMPTEGSPKLSKRRRQTSKGKPLAPSKRLRLEAQRVLKERVQEIADRKGLKIRFCSFRDCEDNHGKASDSPCAAIRAELGWPAGVPFAHPHDLPNRAKQAFLEAYEPGWSAFQDGELGLIESPLTHSNH